MNIKKIVEELAKSASDLVTQVTEDNHKVIVYTDTEDYYEADKIVRRITQKLIGIDTEVCNYASLSKLPYDDIDEDVRDTKVICVIY